MANDPVYKQPPKMSRGELEVEFATDDPERILNALLAAFYTEQPDWVETRCYMFASHPGMAARNGAAIVLGNIGCCYSLSDFNRAAAVLELLRCDPDPTVRMNAQDSLNWILERAEKESRPNSCR
jgi:hypothetical protein